MEATICWKVCTLSLTLPPGPGKVDIGIPIDMPFTEINKIIEAQFAGKTFPEDGSGAVNVTVKKATVAASGDRLLISRGLNQPLLANAGHPVNCGYDGAASDCVTTNTSRNANLRVPILGETPTALAGSARVALGRSAQVADASKISVRAKSRRGSPRFGLYPKLRVST